jgi:hypothetical protein
MTKQEIALKIAAVSWPAIQVGDECAGEALYNQDFGIVGQLLKLPQEESIRLLLDVIEAQQLSSLYPEADSPFKDMMEFNHT